MFTLIAAKMTGALSKLENARGRRGVTMLEYVLLGLMIVLVAVVLWNVFGPALRGAFERLSDAIG